MEQECAVFNCKKDPIYELTSLGHDMGVFCSLDHLIHWVETEGKLIQGEE